MSGPSKWSVLYYSESKKAHLRLEDMPFPHLENALAKQERLGQGMSELAMCLRGEIEARKSDESFNDEDVARAAAVAEEEDRRSE